MSTVADASPPMDSLYPQAQNHSTACPHHLKMHIAHGSLASHRPPLETTLSNSTLLIGVARLQPPRYSLNRELHYQASIGVLHSHRLTLPSLLPVDRAQSLKMNRYKVQLSQHLCADHIAI